MNTGEKFITVYVKDLPENLRKKSQNESFVEVIEYLEKENNGKFVHFVDVHRNADLLSQPLNGFNLSYFILERKSTLKSGVELIAEERDEQIQRHGRTQIRDVNENYNGHLGDGAIMVIKQDLSFRPKHWDEKLCIHMCSKNYKERLIIAGALLAAEIDRLQFNKQEQ